MYLISIIVPIFNTRKYLRRCIESVLSQNIESYEVILVNDKSTDGSEKICDNYKKKRNIKVIHNKKNIGAGSSRNIGINKAKGKYIIFLDSDDLLYKNCLKQIEKIIKKKKSLDLIITKFVAEEYPYSNNYLFKKKFKENGIINFFEHINKINYQANVCWHYLIKKNFILRNKIKFSKAKINEDQEFVTKILCLMSKFSFYKGRYYWHRERFGSLNRSIDLSATKSFLIILDNLSKFLKERNWIEQKNIFINSQIKTAVIELSSRIVLHSKKDLIKIKDFINKNNIKFELLDYNNLKFLNKKKKKIEDLLKFKENFTLKVLKKLNSNNLKSYKIIIYCASVYGIAIYKILKKKYFKIIGLVDDNKKLDSKKVSNILVNKPEKLLSQYKEKNNKKIIIVCAQVKDTYQGIVKNLLKYKISKDKIIFYNYVK